MRADAPAGPRTDRRAFLGWGGASLAGLVAVGCGEGDVALQGVEGRQRVVTLDFARDGDVAVVNYSLLLQELEGAFYEAVLADPPQGFTAEDLRVFRQIAAHERAHRGLLRAKLGRRAIGPIATDFRTVNFDRRADVLLTAQRMETLGVEAINGAAQYVSLDGPLGLEPLLAAGEIVSVEARHAATVADLRSPGRATEEFSPRAFDAAKPPDEALNEASAFLRTLVRLVDLPAPEET